MLTLAALLCRERLLSRNSQDNERIVVPEFFTGFDTLLNGQDINNKREVFEEMIMSLTRVLTTITDDEFMYELLDGVLDNDIPSVRSLDGVVDQYCIRRMDGHRHNVAFEAVMEELFTSVEKWGDMERSRSCRTINKELA